MTEHVIYQMVKSGALVSTLPVKGTMMALRFLGKWSGSPNGDSPSIWIDDENDTYVMQGWKVIDENVINELLETSGRDHLPANETLIRFPKEMTDLFPEADRGSPDL